MSIFGTPAIAVGGQNSGASSVATATTLNTSSGDLLVVAVAWRDSNGRTLTVGDTAGNSFTPLTKVGPDTLSEFVQFFYCLSASPNAANTITGTFSGNISNNANVICWDVPLSGSATIDVQAGASGVSPSPTSAAFSTTGTDEIVFACEISPSVDGSDPATAGSGYTLDSATFYSSGQADSAAEHVVFSSTQTGITASFTNTGNQYFSIGVAAFKAGSAPPPPVQRQAQIMFWY